MATRRSVRGVIARLVSRVAPKEGQPSELSRRNAFAMLRDDAQLFRSLPWDQFSHNEDPCGGDHPLAGRQEVPRHSFQTAVGFLTALYSLPQFRRPKRRSHISFWDREHGNQSTPGCTASRGLTSFQTQTLT